MQVSNFSNYGKNQLTFNGYASKLNAIKPRHHVKVEESTAKFIAKGIITVAKEMTTKESLKTMEKGTILGVKDSLICIKQVWLDAPLQLITNKAIVDGKLVRPRTEALKMVMPVIFVVGLIAMAVGSLGGLVEGGAVALLSGAYVYKNLIKKQITPLKDRNPLEIAAKLIKFYNKKNPLKNATLPEIESHLKNLSITPLKDRNPREIISKLKGFIKKAGIKKQIDLVPLRRNIWISDFNENIT